VDVNTIRRVNTLPGHCWRTQGGGDGAVVVLDGGGGAVVVLDGDVSGRGTTPYQ